MSVQVYRHGLLAAITVLAFTTSLRVEAARPSETLLPATTKAYVSVPDVDLLRSKFDETQFGHLLQEPEMQPCIEDFKRQLKAKLNQTDSRLGITWDDLEGVYGGEVSLALVQPWDMSQQQQAIEAAVAQAIAKAKEAGKSESQIKQIEANALQAATAQQKAKRAEQRAIVVLVDVTGHEQQAEALLVKIDKSFAERGATKSSQEISGVAVTVYTMPAEQGSEARQAFVTIHEDQLVAVDHASVTAEVLARLQGQGVDAPSLAEIPAFKTSQARCREAFGETQVHLSWFLEPFGYVEVARAYNGGRTSRGPDILKILGNQGFKAVQGLGGVVALSTTDYEVLHRTLVYAPAVERAAGDDSTEKYDLAARMLDFPNRAPLGPHDWVPRGLGMFLSFNWRLKKAFYASETLVNEIAGDEVFRDVLESIKTDPNGPQIDVERQLVDFLGERVTLISDYRLPIDPKSERLLAAIQVTNADAVMRTVNQAMESDPAAKKREFEGHVIWEILNDAPAEVETLQIDGPGFGFGDLDEPVADEEEDKPVIPNAAVTVAYGQLIVASHVDYVVDVLKERTADDRLGAAADYNLVMAALEQLGAGNNSFQFFTRTDEAYRVTYELMRQNKMPESESVLGKVLNRLFEPEEEGVLREQQIDGSKMPDYQLVRRYLGPGGFYVTTEDDGWTVMGCLLTKDAE